ncbi:hypothetical protein WN943_025624 [Citrus x changshan-huyou]
MASTACRNGIVQKGNSKSSSFKSRPHPLSLIGIGCLPQYFRIFLPGRVRMTVRLQPRNVEETAADADFANCVKLQIELKRLKLRKNNWNSDTYEFDEVFTESALQKGVYEVVTKPVVEVCYGWAFKSLMSYSVAVPGFRFKKLPMAAGVVMARPRRVVVVRAEAQGINLDIRKMEEKVVDSIVVTDLSKPLTAYCRYFNLVLFRNLNTRSI